MMDGWMGGLATRDVRIFLDDDKSQITAMISIDDDDNNDDDSRFVASKVKQQLAQVFS